MGSRLDGSEVNGSSPSYTGSDQGHPEGTENDRNAIVLDRKYSVSHSKPLSRCSSKVPLLPGSPAPPLWPRPPSLPLAAEIYLLRFFFIFFFFYIRFFPDFCSVFLGFGSRMGARRAKPQVRGGGRGTVGGVSNFRSKFKFPFFCFNFVDSVNFFMKF